MPKMQILTTNVGINVALYINGRVKTATPSGNSLEIITDTDYPVSGKITVTVSPEKPEKFTLGVRVPEWSKSTSVLVNGEKIAAPVGFTFIEREWQSGDKINVELDMTPSVIYPTPYGEATLMTDVDWRCNLSRPFKAKEHPTAKSCVAIRRGPVMMALDARLGVSPDEKIDLAVDGEKIELTASASAPEFAHLIALDAKRRDGSTVTLIDYSSAGKTLDEKSKCAVWLEIKAE